MTSDKKFTIMGITIIILLVILIALNIKRPPFPPGRPFSGNHDKMFSELLDKIDATQKQRTQLEKQQQATMDKIHQIHKQLSDYKDEIREELEKENPDLTKVKDIHIKMKQRISDKEDLMLNMILNTHKILSNEQFKKLHNIIRKKHKHLPPPHM